MRYCILRLDENQFYAQEYKVKYKDSAAFIMNPGDKIFVYENTNYNKVIHTELRVR